MNAFQDVWDLLFPPRCIFCKSLLKKGELDLCRNCRREAPEYQNTKRDLPFLDSFAAVWYYEEYARDSLLRYKFGGARRYAPGYGRFLAMKISQTYPQGFDCLTWVPVSFRRKWKRGYDQTALLARAVGNELGMTCVPLLRKVRHNPAQSSVYGLAERRANVLGAYRLIGKTPLEGKRILLIDDILTTGSTAGEAARILKTGGAKEVHCAALAATRKEI